MQHDLTISVDDTLYAALQPMVEQQTIGEFLHEILRVRTQSAARPVLSIESLRGTLPNPADSAILEETARLLKRRKKVVDINQLFGAFPNLDSSNVREEEDREI